MCGQAGVFSTLPLSESEIQKVNLLLILNHARGTDATGSMQWSKKTGETLYKKTNHHPFYFSAVTLPKDILPSLRDSNLFSVHCRSATVGEKKQANSHPFVHKHIVGMHNGTILADFKNKKDFDTDSDALYHNVAEYGIEETIKELNKGSPAYALVWIDTQEKTLNFLRNGLRPLFIHHLGSTVFWSSLSKDLDYAVEPNDKAGKTSDGITKGDSLFFEIDKHYKINLEAPGEITWTAKIVKPDAPVYNYSMGGSGHSNPNFPKKTGGESTTWTNESFTSVEGYSDIVWDFLKEKTVDKFKEFMYYVHPKIAGKKFHYAVELDAFLELKYYLTLVLWRMQNPSEFLRLLNETAVEHTQAYVEKILSWTGLTKNQYKSLLRGKFPMYITHPWRVDDNKLVPLKFVPWELERAATLSATTKGTNVIPFVPDETPWDDEDPADEVYEYGVSNKVGGLKEVEELLYNGCANCTNPEDVNSLSSVYWVTDEDWLCTDCQDGLIGGSIHPLFPNLQNLYDFVKARELEEETEHKVALN